MSCKSKPAPPIEVEDIICDAEFDLEVIARDLAVALSTLQMAGGYVNGIVSEFVQDALDNYDTYTDLCEDEEFHLYQEA